MIVGVQVVHDLLAAFARGVRAPQQADQGRPGRGVQALGQFRVCGFGADGLCDVGDVQAVAAKNLQARRGAKVLFRQRGIQTDGPARVVAEGLLIARAHAD